MPPEITLDARHLHSGIGTYAHSLLRYLPIADVGFEYLALVREVDSGLPRYSNLRYQRVNAAIYTVREQLLVPCAAVRGSLFHAMHYNFPVFFRGPLVVTIHDLTHLMYPEFLPNRRARFYAETMLKRAVARAQVIVAVSEFTKQQLIRLLNVPTDKVEVIWPGVGVLPADDEATPLPGAVAGKPYLLYVGNLKPHKNVERLLRAFCEGRRQYRWEHQLVLAGEGDIDLYKQLIPAEEQNHVVFLGRVTDGVLWRLYREAELFVMPSLSEGFGFCALEAQRCGTVVAVARATSLPEVLGNSAVYFDPLNVDEMAEAIHRGLTDSSLRDCLRLLGKEQVNRFCWSKVAQRYVDVYRKVVGAWA